MSPLLFGELPCCAPKLWLNWPWSSESLLFCVAEQDCYPPPCTRTATAAAPTPTLQLREWDVTDLARCHIWHSNLRGRLAYWFACVCYSKLWLAFAKEPALLHTSLNCVARKFSASRARINQRVPSTKTTLLDLLKKVCLWKNKVSWSFFTQNSSVFIMHKANWGINKEAKFGTCKTVAQCQRCRSSIVSVKLDFISSQCLFWWKDRMIAFRTIWLLLDWAISAVRWWEIRQFAQVFFKVKKINSKRYTKL